MGMSEMVKWCFKFWTSSPKWKPECAAAAPPWKISSMHVSIMIAYCYLVWKFSNLPPLCSTIAWPRQCDPGNSSAPMQAGVDSGLTMTELKDNQVADADYSKFDQR